MVDLYFAESLVKGLDVSWARLMLEFFESRVLQQDRSLLEITAEMSQFYVILSVVLGQSRDWINLLFHQDPHLGFEIVPLQLVSDLGPVLILFLMYQFLHRHQSLPLVLGALPLFLLFHHVVKFLFLSFFFLLQLDASDFSIGQFRLKCVASLFTLDRAFRSVFLRLRRGPEPCGWWYFEATLVLGRRFTSILILH